MRNFNMAECFLRVLCALYPVLKDRLIERLNLVIYLLKGAEDNIQ